MKVKKFKKDSKNKKVVTASSRQSLGINFTDKSINMVLLSARSLNQFCLEKYVIVPLPKNIIDNGSIEDHNEFVALLQQAKDRLQSNCKNIVVSIPQKLTNLQILPHDPDLEYTEEEQVMMELSQYESLDEVSYDYQNIMTDKDGIDQIMLASAKREDVNLIMDVFADADIIPTQMDVDLIAIMNAAISFINAEQPELAEKCVAVFNIDLNGTQAIIMRNSVMLYKQEISIGYEHLVQSIRRNYQLTDDEAWDVLFRTSKPEDYDKTVIEPFKQQFTQEIQRVLQFYFTSASQESDIDKIIVFGFQDGNTTEFAKEIKQQTNISTQLLNPVLIAQTDSRIDDGKLHNQCGLLTVAFGLAVQGL